MIKENEVQEELPSGYQWRIVSHGDDEGILVKVALVQSPFNKGSWRDRLFGREIMHSYFEADLEASEETISVKMAATKEHIKGIFFRE